MKQWSLRIASGLLVLVVAGLGATWLWLRASLPALDGDMPLAGLTQDVAVTRDALGVVTVRAANAADLARATGFVHAQERFFQMDLLRRSAAGEVAGLIGADALPFDQERRRHDLRNVARRVLAESPAADRETLAAYADGVNAGLAALGARPFEYGLLHQAPAPWKPEDSFLAVFAMYFDLHDADARRERYLAALYEVFPPAFVEFLVPAGTRWDAPMLGEAMLPPAPPGPELVDFRGREPATAPASAASNAAPAPGSNSWAVDDALSSTGAPLVANDMHLGHGVPNIWFRLRLELAGPNGFTVTGVSLPGVPGVIAGSNGHIAWGFTNSYGDWIDLVRLDTGDCADGYVTPQGCEAFERVTTLLDVAHGDPEPFEFLRSRWGPVLEGPSNGETAFYALRWTAHEPAATNLRLGDMARAGDVHAALDVAHRAGMPPQNFVVGDGDGNIAWTIIGRIPRRVDHDGRLPLDSATTGHVWQGWLAPEEYPALVNPAHGRLWTANARIVDGASLAVIGDGGYALGARAAQIRDRLFAQDRFTPGDMLSIQLDDAAPFFVRWRDLLLTLLDDVAVVERPARAELRDAVRDWQGHAAVDSVAYRVVRAFRDEIFDVVFDGLTAQVRTEFPGFGFGAFTQSEGPLWWLVTEQPPHLLPPGHEDWRALLLVAADTVHAELTADGRALEQRTWGERNTTHIEHPFGQLPLLGLLLNAPSRPLPGDNHMPRVQGRKFGASERFAVSPGHEAEGYFHMPGGQSGHPLSPYHLAGHADWEEGRPTPFLPGPAQHTLRLVPLTEKAQ